jgi:uncharacterized protein (TIGR00369 family)
VGGKKGPEDPVAYNPAVSTELARDWFEACPFHAFLGLEPVSLAPDRIRLRLPFDVRLTNNGAVLHGGLAAALAGISSRALWLASGGRGVAHLASLHVSYVSAADGDLAVEARLVRSGRNVCFAQVEISSSAGRRVGDALSTLRLRAAPQPGGYAHAALPDLDPALPALQRAVSAPFLVRMGFEVLGMGEGASRVLLPWRPELGDGPGFHDGALLALLDCAGAMSSHAAHGAPAPRNATIALQAQVFSPDLPASDLLALARCALRDDDIYWNEVQIARDATRELLARGSVIYRIGA